MASDVVAVTVSVTVTSPTISSLVLRYGVSAAAVALIVYGVKHGHLKNLQRRLFALIATRFTSDHIRAAVDGYKEPLFACLRSLESAEPLLRYCGPGVLRILEIGVGDGANLKYYPPGCHLTSVEPNPFFESYFAKNSYKFPHITIKKFIRGSAEDMSDVQSESVDVVVSTHVLCSVTDVDACLKEIRRVLTPGGQFLFLEHVAYTWKDNWVAALAQVVSEPIWSLLSDGCRLRRDPRPLILANEFRLLKEKVVMIDAVYGLMKPHVIGIAQKAVTT